MSSSKQKYHWDINIISTISKHVNDQLTSSHLSQLSRLFHKSSISELYRGPQFSNSNQLNQFNETLNNSKKLTPQYTLGLTGYIKVLDLTSIKEQIPIQLLNNVLYNCNLLQVIKINNNFINSRTLQLISIIHGAQLRELDLSGCTTSDIDIFMQFQYRMGNLKILKLSCTFIGDYELLNVITLSHQSLQCLNVEGCDRLTEYSRRLILKLLPDIPDLKLPYTFGYDYKDHTPFYVHIEAEIIKGYKNHTLVSLYDFYTNQPRNVTFLHHLQRNPDFFKHLLASRSLSVAIIKEIQLTKLKFIELNLNKQLKSKKPKMQDADDYPETNLSGLRWNLPQELISNKTNKSPYILISKPLWAHWNPNYKPKVSPAPLSIDKPKNQPTKDVTNTITKSAATVQKPASTTKVSRPILGRYPVAGGLYNTQPTPKPAPPAPAPASTTAVAPSATAPSTCTPQPTISLPIPTSPTTTIAKSLTPMESTNYYNNIDDALIQTEREEEELELEEAVWKLLPKLDHPVGLKYEEDSPIHSDLDLSFD